MRISRTGLLGGLSTLTLICAAAPALAQQDAPAAPTSASGTTSPTPPAGAGGTQLGEIIVTAQKRSENLQKVPIAVTAITGAALQARGLENIRDLSISVPGLVFENFNGLVLPFLRGVGNSGTAAGNEPSVATYVDGVYFARLSSSFFDLRNIDQIEVLKGPQGTLFGRNSTGGVINIITRDPSFTPQLSGSLGYGTFHKVEGNVYGSTRLTDKAALDFSLSAKTDKGFGRNLTTGGGYGYEDSVLFRSKLLVEPTDATKIVVSGFYSWSRQSIPKTAFPGTATGSVSLPHEIYTTQTIGYYNSIDDVNSHSVFNIWGFSGRIEQTLPFAKLISISAYSQSFEHTVVDVDYTPRPDALALLYGPVHLFTQEFQLVNKPGSPFNWILGAYYYHNYTAYSTVGFLGDEFPGPGLTAPAHQLARSYAGYGQATYEILRGLKLTGGIRYTVDLTTAHGIIALATNPPIVVQDVPPGRDREARVTFRAAVDYQFTRDILGYFSFNRGFKSGNFNILTYGSDKSTRPEGLDAYEVGIKSELFNRRLRLNGALFQYNISNPQVQLEAFGTVLFSNAGGSRVKGAEFEADAAIAPGLVGRASLTYLDSKYTNYFNAPATMPDLVNGGAIPLPPINAAGHYTPLAAKVTLNVGADYSFHTAIGQMTLTADYYHNSGYYFEPDNLLHQTGYDLVNSQLRDQLTDRFAVRVWVRNLTNTKYVAAASTIAGPDGYQWAPAPPRTYGVAVDFKL